MKKVTLKSILAEYDKRMKMLCDHLVPDDDVQQEVYKSVKNMDRRELKEIFHDYQSGLYSEDFVIEGMIERVTNNVHFYAHKKGMM